MLQKGEEEDEKREEAIASNPSLQPNFKPKRVTQDQLSKLQWVISLLCKDGRVRILHRLLVRLACSYELFSHEVVDLSSKKCKGIAEGIVVKDMHSLADCGLHLVSYLLSIIKGEPFFLMESHDGVLGMCGVELHKRRLQIKSKIHKKSKDGTSKSHGKDLKNKDTGTNIEDSGAPDLKPLDDNASFSTPQENVSAHHSEKKRQKLHWGLDTKERWERKANM
ncbi:hypothetical protein POTOM_055274 [Populus tomentosa]|uniref:Uncharacterized protein n=1 Tax=Populus tomentosa TaxID=118781 RepID=A0A8X7Y3Z4_POPTO|nr:hypothetical protein POTOM_055274 [Populus tomentosa]